MCKKLQLLGDFIPQIPYWSFAMLLDHTGGLPTPSCHSCMKWQ